MRSRFDSRVVRPRQRRTSTPRPIATAAPSVASAIAPAQTILVALLALILEGHRDLRAVTFDLPVLERYGELLHLGHAKIADRLGRALDRRGRGLLPRLGARAHQLDDFVHAFRHWSLRVRCCVGRKETTYCHA